MKTIIGASQCRVGARYPWRRLWMGVMLTAAVLVCVVPATATAERLSVITPVANVRSGPGTNYDVLWQIEQYHPIEIVEKSGSWYRFRDYQGDMAYIHNSLLGDVEAVITAESRCNVRTGPGTNYPVAFTVGDGIPFRVLQKKHNWLKVVHADGSGGWIYRSLVW